MFSLAIDKVKCRFAPRLRKAHFQSEKIVVQIAFRLLQHSNFLYVFQQSLASSRNSRVACEPRPLLGTPKDNVSNPTRLMPYLFTIHSIAISSL
jgi:hypothetical protein